MLKPGSCSKHVKAFTAAKHPQRWYFKQQRAPKQMRHTFSRSYAVEGSGRVAVDSTENETQPNARLIEFKDGAYTVKGAFDTSASIDDVWSILVDYPGLAGVFTNIKDSRVVSREPDIVLHQDCKWEFLIFSGKFKTELSVKEDADNGCLTFNLIASSFMKHFVGQWQLQRSGKEGCKVEHTLTVEPTISPPPFMKDYTQRIFVKQVASILSDLEQELVLRQSKDYDYLDL